MKRLLITLLLAFVALPMFAQVEQDCGAIDCPGRCGRFIDQNGDGFCDHGRLSEAAKPTATVTTAEPQKAEKSELETQAQKQPATATPAKRVHNEEAPSHNDIAAEDAHTGATQLEEPQPQPQPVEPVQEEETAPASGGSPYHLVLITLLTIGLFALTRILVAANVIKLATHRKIWNVVLLITALMSCLIGLFLVFQVNYNIKMEWFWTLKVLHVEFGIAMTIIAILHIFWHMNYWKTLFKGKKNQGKA